MSNEISFNPTNFKELKRLYFQAVKEGKESFMFEGHEVLTSYAKYLIEYLSSRFDTK
jgi:hypothetical protein